MSEFIVASIIVIGGVNWLYSRFCEQKRGSSGSTSRQVLHRQAQKLTIQALNGWL
ncbi:MAG TPA: hypothetical protein VGI60_07520 [Chthoniobacterales bacterium]|jgi:hypothetical protein